MALNTNTYGYVIDPLFSFCDQGGKTIANGYVRVFRAGTSTPVLTYRNFDGAFNAETIELDNSGRTMTKVIASKGDLYKVCVYDAEHSQEDPVLTVDKVAVIGASVNATNIVQGMNDVSGSGWIKSVSADDTANVSLDPTGVSDHVETFAQFGTHDQYKVPLVKDDGSQADAKLSHLMLNTAQNALAGNVATAFVPNSTTIVAGQLYVYNGSLYLAKVSGYQGPWDSSKFNSYSVENLKFLADLNNYICARNSIQLDNGVIGYYLDASGEFVESNTHYVSDYFAVSENDVVVWTSGEVNNSIVLALYDSDKKFVSYYRASANPRTITIGSGYSFIRASFKINVTIGLSIAGVTKDVSITTLSNQILSSIAVESEKKDLRIYNGVRGFYINTSGNFVESNTHYVSDYFAVSENDVIVWTSGEISNDIVLALYDSDKKFVNYYRASSNPRTITIGSGFSFIRASFKKNSVVGLSINGIKKDISLREYTQPVTTIRFGTYNTGDFAGLNMTKGSQEVAMAMREAIADAKCDIMATQEDIPYFNTDLETLSRDECFGLFKNYTRRGSSSLNYKAFASNYKITNIAAVNYTGGYFDHYYFLTGDLAVSGIVIKLICIHLDWSDNTRRQTQLSQLAAYSANYDNVIIMGDFNPENCINYVQQFDPDTYAGMDTSDTDLAILESVGFKSVNGGYLPKKNTYYGAYTRNYVWRCDNILVKSTDGKLVYKDLCVLHNDYMNDHFIVYSDISILSE